MCENSVTKKRGSLLKSPLSLGKENNREQICPIKHIFSFFLLFRESIAGILWLKHYSCLILTVLQEAVCKCAQEIREKSSKVTKISAFKKHICLNS